jgi:Flp pilus assembly protein TadD
MCVLKPSVDLRGRALLTAITMLAVATVALGQRPASVKRGQTPSATAQSGPVALTVSVRDSRGMPLETPAIVRLYSAVKSYNRTAPTQEASSAVFPDVAAGEYQIEARCEGYKTATDQVTVGSLGAELAVFIYLHPESEDVSAARPASGMVMTPKLQAMIDKGLEATRKRQYGSAKAIFEKALQLAPGNPDVLYLLGTSELGLQNTDLAKKNFERALQISPSHEKALLAMGEMQLKAGDATSAIITLEKAFAMDGASWRTHLLLANAYATAGRFPEAETHASRAASLAGEKSGAARLLLGNIQDAEGKHSDAQQTWEHLATELPSDPSARVARQKLASTSEKEREAPKDIAVNLLLQAAGADTESNRTNQLWAPPDIDGQEYSIAPNVACETETILEQALLRVNSQMENFEKFTATERIEHQEIDRRGLPGEVKSRSFSYIVFVKPYKDDSFYLEESRDGGENLNSFPTSLATTGLNSLGVSLLLPAYHDGFIYQCEGLGSMRGEAAWLVRFEEKKNKPAGVRQWRKNGIIYDVPVKGRIWISATSFNLLRIETDLREPVEKLELTRDHLSVDYGPIKFERGNETLWLPWSAEMYMELHRKRYHHKHYLTDYLLFEVDTANKVGKPKESAPPGEASP